MSGKNEAAQKRLDEIMEKLEQGVKDVFTSEKYTKYLSTMAKFHDYSFNNILLIAMQRPNATLIAGYQAWKKNFQRNVMQGEKGIRILAPSPYKIKQNVEKKDPLTGKTLTGEDGKPVMEEKEVTIPAYKVVTVFDVSQTEGKELPTIADELTGDVEQYEGFFAALEKTSPVPISFEKIKGSAHGYYRLEEKRIAIDEGMSELQNLKTAIHEIAHAKMHDIDLNASPEQQQARPNRRVREVQAESVAYIVCQHYGLDTSDYSFEYVATWSSGREVTELKESLTVIRNTASELIKDIDKNLAQIQKAREAEKEKAMKKETEVTLMEIGGEMSEEMEVKVWEKRMPDLAPVEQLAVEIDRFIYDWDPALYRDSVSNMTEGVSEIVGALKQRDTHDIAMWLADVVTDGRSPEEIKKALELLNKLVEYKPLNKIVKMKAPDKKKAQEAGEGVTGCDKNCRQSVLENLHNKQNEINRDQKNTEQKNIEKSDGRMER